MTDVTASNITSDSITLNVTASGGTNNIAKYYYSKDNGATWVNSTSSSYTFTGLTAGTTYNFKVYVEDTVGHQSNQSGVSAITDNPTLADVCPSGGNFANCIKMYYSTYGEGTVGLYYHDGQGSYTNANQEAGDNSYRYSGANPNNYVCFGSDEATCPADNLYRIIGVFGNQVKLIKNTSIGNNYWSGSSSNTSNTWSSSTLNTETLNGTYLNELGSTWSSKIATTNWKVGGNTYQKIYNVPVKQTYTNEIESPTESTTYSAKIGLMYVSDYGYAASPDYWTTKLYNYEPAKDSDWMAGLSEWTISRRSDNANCAFRVLSEGFVGYNGVSASNGYIGVRPSFYLESSVVLSGGTGSASDPYRIA